MNFKKVIAAALAATLALSTVAYGEPIKGNTEEKALGKVVTVSCTAACTVDKGEMKEISGKIETLTKYDMTVKTEDGSIYRVILGPFEKQTGYNDLRLAVGTTVKLKGAELKIVTMPLNEADIKNMVPSEGTSDVTATVITTDSIDGATVKQCDSVASVICTEAMPTDVMTGEAIIDGSFENGEVQVMPAVKIADGDKMFFTDEITANGKIVKLNP